MRALITGAFGFAGTYLIEHLLKAGDKVVGTYLHHSPTDPTCEAIKLDITDINACTDVIGKVKPDVIYNLAAVTFVPEAEKDFNRTLAINVAGTHNIFRACIIARLQSKIVLISSSEVYGKILPSELPVDEDVLIRPAHNYSLSKAMSELVAKRYEQDKNLSAVIVRAFNHIGGGQRVEFVVSNFAYQLAKIAKGQAPPTIKVGNLDAKRDFTDVRDIVRGYRLAAERGHGIYNLCSGKAVPVRSILETLIEISGAKVTVEQDPERARPAEVPELYGSFERAKRELGWAPTFTLRDSLEEAYKFWHAKLSTVSNSPTPSQSRIEKNQIPSFLKDALDEIRSQFHAGPQSGVFTDGGARPNPGPGGWGVVFVKDGKIISENFGHAPQTTNNRMELTALIEAYKMIKPDERIDVYSDSELCVNTITKWAKSWEKNGWKRKAGPVENLDLVKELYYLSQKRPGAKLQWIRSHNGWLWNEYADTLASAWCRS